MTRYFFIILLMGVVGFGVIAKAAYTMFVKKQYWTEVADRFIKENVPIFPIRGNILSADDKLMASSLPQYKIYLDFQAGDTTKDAIMMKDLTVMCKGLHRILPNKSAAQFRNRILKGRQKKSRSWLLYPTRISYIQYKQIKTLPFFSFSSNKSGFYAEQFNQRTKPFGSLALRTLGDMYPDTALGAKNGLELAYDSLLKGTPGKTHRQKVMNHYLNIMDVPPEDGCDIVSTIDVSMQDISEKALVDELKEINGDIGIVILMDVATGDVKAIVNMTKCADGNYYEIQNNAITSLMEPGSTFKTASIMVGLEDGRLSLNDGVDTKNGVVTIHGRQMKDHNWRHGGYHYLTLPQIMMNSSNVGVSSLIDQHYYADPQTFVKGLYREGINADLHLPFQGAAKARIRMPNKKNWTKTALAWMSIGYETQIPPINMATFYNAIANNGIMVKPRFVTEALRKGKVVKKMPVEVLKPAICSPRTLGKIKYLLREVVKDGLGKKAGSTQFDVSGKTGTAQISQGIGGYKTNGVHYLLSFCGYFPSEAPKYSLYVSIQKAGLPASGGGMAGVVFHKISERIFAKSLSTDLSHAIDSNAIKVPLIKAGNISEMKQVLTDLQIQNLEQNKAISGYDFWGWTKQTTSAVIITPENINTSIVPNVLGMGARDAVFLLEKCKLKVHLSGVGKVVSQSIPQGSKLIKGKTIAICLN
jgi:cell division protein FtsI (penicillin-binding protein 3)